jgi:hypothetical protein
MITNQPTKVPTLGYNMDRYLAVILITENANCSREWNNNVMEHSPSWATACLSTSKEIPRSLFYRDIHYDVHKTTSLVRILRQLNPVHTRTSYFLRSILILSLLLWVNMVSGGMVMTGENRRTRRKIFPSATLFSTNPTWTDLGSKPGLRGDKRLTAWAMARPF